MTIFSFKRYLFKLLFIFTFIIALIGNNLSFASSKNSTEILWDNYGVPHIYAQNTEQLFYAFAQAQMHSHGDLILRLYGQARGKAAEYWGEEYLESDRWLNTLEVPERSQLCYEQQEPQFRNYLDAFARGINDYVAKNKDLIDDEVEVVLPVTGVDILAHLQRLIPFIFVLDPTEFEPLKQEWESGNIVTNLTKKYSNGSNGWAIAPARSASKNTMLLANPHLPWTDLFLWYETHLNAPGINLYGASLVGIPVLSIAFNNNLGWTHTINPMDGWDLYELNLVENGYRWDNTIRPLETKKMVIKVKQKDNFWREESLVIKKSIHGSIVTQKQDKALALKIVGLDKPKALQQWWNMGIASNLEEFKNAIKPLQIPTFNIIYSDKVGHIFNLFNGQIPVHSQGDFKYWSGIIPGDTSATLWEKTHDYDDLPITIDPSSGWLQNTNDPPWTTTFPPQLNSDDYPAYLAPNNYMGLRSQRSVKMLVEDEQISFEEMIQDKHSTRVELGDRVLDELITLAKQDGEELLQKAAEVLANWDRQTNADSRGAVLFAFWGQNVDLTDLFATPWQMDNPLNTPANLVDPQGAIKALATAAEQVKNSYGRLDVPWGEVFRLRMGDLDLPANGGANELGIFRTVSFFPTEDGHFKAFDGDSFVLAVEFSEAVKAMALMSYGNATQSHLLASFGGKALESQLKLFSEQKLRPVWRTLPEIKEHLALIQRID